MLALRSTNLTIEHSMKQTALFRSFFCLILLLAGSLTRAESRMLIVSIDGLRPDCALRAKMPVLRSLTERGAFSFWAYTTPVAITLPSHASMLTGVTVERHGFSGNDDKAAATQKIQVPTLFDIARKAGISTGMAAGKTKFSIFSDSGAIDHSWIKATTDDNVAGQAVNILRQHQPRLMLVHFAEVDGVGHSKGWGSRDQIAAIERADAALGMVIDELKRLELFDKTTILITADHGGSGKTHGKDDDRSRFIPWILVGPGIVPNVDLSQFRELQINTYDTFATACKIMELTTPEGIDGKAIVQAFKATDLMNSPAPATQPAASLPDARSDTEKRRDEAAENLRKISIAIREYAKQESPPFPRVSATTQFTRAGPLKQGIGGDLSRVDAPATAPTTAPTSVPTNPK